MLPTHENNFGIEVYLVMLVANRVPYLAKHEITVAERQTWNAHREGHITQALSGIDVKKALGYVRHPAWQWDAEVAPANVPVVGIPMR
jgi:tryptophan 7-halogenase